MSDQSTDIGTIYREYLSYLEDNNLVEGDGPQQVVSRIAALMINPDREEISTLRTFMSENGYLGIASESTDGFSEIGFIGQTLSKISAAIFDGESARNEATIESTAATLFPGGLRDINDPSFGTGEQRDKFFQWLVDNGYMDGEAANSIIDMINSGPFGANATKTIIIAGIVLNFASTIGQIVGGDKYKELLSAYTPNAPDATALLKPYLIAKNDRESILNLMKESGYKTQDIRYLLLNNETVFEWTDVREQFLRGIITEDQARSELERGGYTPDRIDALMQTWSIIPSPQDLFWMVSKEAFEDEQSTYFGLDDEFPTEQLEWLNKQGYSTYWARKFWRAHWSAPSIQMGYEMLHRGLIDEHELDLLFRVQEIPSFWRDRLMKMSYPPLTRVDVRRMYRSGSIDLETVYKTYRDLGYNDENARMLTDWTETEYGPETKELTRSQIENAYSDGLVTEQQAIQLFKQSGYSDGQAQWLISNVNFQKTKELRKRQIGIVESRFKAGVIDEAEAKSQLSQLEISGPRIEVYIEEWRIDMQADVKWPSKTDLSKFIKAGLIDRDTYRSYMGRIGYPKALIELYLQLDVGSTEE